MHTETQPFSGFVISMKFVKPFWQLYFEPKVHDSFVPKVQRDLREVANQGLKWLELVTTFVPK